MPCGLISLQEWDNRVIFQSAKTGGGGGDGAPLWGLPHPCQQIHLFVIKQKFPECLLNARYFSSNEQRDKNLTVMEVTFYYLKEIILKSHANKMGYI